MRQDVNRKRLNLRLRKKQSKHQGQTMMEYIVLVVLLAVASIPVTKILGDVFRDRVLESADKIAGDESYESQGENIVEEGNEKVKRSMKDF